MKIKSKVLTSVHWFIGDKRVTAIVSPAKLHYNTIDAHDVIIREQLYALLDAKLLDFEPKLGRPSIEELTKYFMRPRGPKEHKEEIVEVRNVRAIETGSMETGRDDDTNSGGGGVPDEVSDAGPEGSEVAERRHRSRSRASKVRRKSDK